MFRSDPAPKVLRRRGSTPAVAVSRTLQPFRAETPPRATTGVDARGSRAESRVSSRLLRSASTRPLTRPYRAGWTHMSRAERPTAPDIVATEFWWRTNLIPPIFPQPLQTTGLSWISHSYWTSRLVMPYNAVTLGSAARWPSENVQTECSVGRASVLRRQTKKRSNGASKVAKTRSRGSPEPPIMCQLLSPANTPIRASECIGQLFASLRASFPDLPSTPVRFDFGRGYRTLNYVGSVIWGK